ncbi:histidinol phosphate phosphatase H [Wolfiporia cocos MD-104 SS10]|uniref:Histidinol-phosphatase n=1 Tax=Wolfiporia cocos (strain MD-104) TaxID=742152 RepID=A0A2H3JWL7_WOLCO|nr:histidinol phosphate phosphatase H [Wolfiporia cocos MD-104 SS10]
MPYSHHSHSGQFCKHASGTLQDVVLEAIRQGFEVYGLTEHVPRYRLEDLYPEEEGTPLGRLGAQFDDFLTEAHRVKECYADKITLLVGLETEFITEADLVKLGDLLQRHEGRIEYLVGSVHHANAIPIDFDRDTYQRALDSFGGQTATKSSADGESAHMDAFLCSYFDAQYQVLSRFHPEIVGHIDLCRLYNPGLRFYDYARARQKLERNIKYAVGYGALFELNAAALRKGWDACYPGEDVVELIKKHGGRFALSDDSHGPHAVGLNYSRLAEYVREVGIDELWVLHRTAAPNAGGRYLHPRRVEGNWWEHSFWSSQGTPTA